MRRVLRSPGQRGATSPATYVLLDLRESVFDVRLIDAPAAAVDDHLAIQINLRTRDADASA